ncbi:MAG TPA: ankyrin repeat domain-containing protein, partial [Bryobacteraceae bacterium]|nr:ankyrin repeat domain-containing protein [Bryobacteraceae bacterium]
HLCFSKYLRLDGARTSRFVRAAKVLLDAGASANTGFWDAAHQPSPEWESALYGAAGVARNPALTKLLLDHGADPNDEETPYHAPETHDNETLKILVESGKLTDDSLATMLLRKADWHDTDGIAFLLAQGADPNRMTRWNHTALHQAIRRDNALVNIQMMLDHGADLTIANRKDGRSAVVLAARRGRADILELFEQRRCPIEVQGVDRLIASCARNDTAQIMAIREDEPHLVRDLLAEGGTLLAEFAGTANTDGIRQLLYLGVKVDLLYEGDGYFEIPNKSTALHVAAWRAWHDTVKFLIEAGAPIDALDAKGRTPLALAVRACVNSYWAYRRSPESVKALLDAGASVGDVNYPTGYDDVDDLLRQCAA